MKLIGIAGSTCSGKTTLLRSLAEELEDKVAILSFDEYFIGSDLYNLDDITNFEDPNLYNFDGFINDLKAIKAGEPVTIRANSRESSESGIKERLVDNKPIVIVEGWLVFHNHEAKKLFDTKIFIDMPEDEIIKRRYSRTKGSRHWDDHDYIKNKILPGVRTYVQPQKDEVDLVLDGMLPQKELLKQVIDHLNMSQGSSPKR